MGGPFTAAGLAGPNAYTLTLQRRFTCSPRVNVNQLKPYHSCGTWHNPPNPGAALGPAGSQVVEQRLICKTCHRRTYYLVRWQGSPSADDFWVLQA